MKQIVVTYASSLVLEAAASARLVLRACSSSTCAKRRQMRAYNATVQIDHKHVPPLHARVWRRVPAQRIRFLEEKEGVGGGGKAMLAIRPQCAC